MQQYDEQLDQLQVTSDEIVRLEIQKDDLNRRIGQLEAESDRLRAAAARRLLGCSTQIPEAGETAWFQIPCAADQTTQTTLNYQPVIGFGAMSMDGLARMIREDTAT